MNGCYSDTCYLKICISALNLWDALRQTRIFCCKLFSSGLMRVWLVVLPSERPPHIWVVYLSQNGRICHCQGEFMTFCRIFLQLLFLARGFLLFGSRELHFCNLFILPWWLLRPLNYSARLFCTYTACRRDILHRLDYNMTFNCNLSKVYFVTNGFICPGIW